MLFLDKAIVRTRELRERMKFVLHMGMERMGKMREPADLVTAKTSNVLDDPVDSTSLVLQREVLLAGPSSEGEDVEAVVG